MKRAAWVPALILGAGVLLSGGVRPQLTTSLDQAIRTALPVATAGEVMRDVELSDEVRSVGGMTDYALVTYAPAAAPAAYTHSIYVGYYARQIRGQTIHSPKNCLPGGGWEALSAQTMTIPTSRGEHQVNRYLLHRDGERALVLYWYQGRGRLEANEYRVKMNLLVDAAVRRRSEEAIVRIVVPVRRSEEEAARHAAAVAAAMIPSMWAALPD